MATSVDPTSTSACSPPPLGRRLVPVLVSDLRHTGKILLRLYCGDGSLKAEKKSRRAVEVTECGQGSCDRGVRSAFARPLRGDAQGSYGLY